MENFLGKCLAIGLVAGGFTVTGDLARLARAAGRLMSASGVPHDPAGDDDAPVPVVRSAGPARPGVAMRPATAPNCPDPLDLARLRPGDRLVVWIGGGVESPPLRLDLVDPASGEAVLQRGVAQRVRIHGERPLGRGERLTLTPLGIARAGQPAAAEDWGPIVGVSIDR